MTVKLDEVRSVAVDEFPKIGLTEEKLLWMLRKMLEIRRFEEKVEELHIVRGLLYGPSHLYFGEEAVAAGVCAALSEGDYIIGTHRGHGQAIAKGLPIDSLMAELFGKETGICKGLGGSMHICNDVEKGALFSTAIVGSGIPVAAGVGLGIKYKKGDQVVACFFGDGAVNTGAFHEGMNLAAIWKLPVIFVCENNMYAISMRASNAVAARSIAERAVGYNIPGVIVNGNDATAVYKITLQAAERARRGEGPTLLECRTYRLKGHSTHDKAEYKPKGEADEWKKRDPIMHLSNLLIKLKMIAQDAISKMDDEIKAEIEKSVESAMKSRPIPLEMMEDSVYARIEV